MKKKILLVLPKNFEINFINVSSIIKKITRKPGGPVVLSLATIAALTPPEFDVRIIDEDVEDIDYTVKYDIVGIGGFSCYLNRAEEIAREFKQRGALIVCGGSPASFSPERWRHFADVLIIGEAERTWPQFLEDYQNDTVKKVYKESGNIDMSESPIPDYSPYAPGILKKYLLGIVQISRGCPFTCEFCSVHEYAGNKMRYKPLDQVIKEVEQLYTVCKSRIIFIADDNFSGNRTRAKDTLKALKTWNQGKRHPVTFVTQLSIDSANDHELLELAAECGLIRVSVGVETPNKESLKETNKVQNLVRDPREGIRSFHEHGIFVQAGCIVGFDHDDKSIFKSQFEFFNSLGIPNIQVMPLQAPDGSPLKRRMIKEGRYIDWEAAARANPENQNSINTFTIKPKQMELEELRRGICWLLKKLYEPENFIHRLELFFRNYEASPKREKIAIPVSRIDWYAIELAMRLMIYVLLKVKRHERKIFRKMYSVTQRSSHPHKLILMANSYLSLLNTRNIIWKSFPDIDSVEYPS